MNALRHEQRIRKPSNNPDFNSLLDHAVCHRPFLAEGIDTIRNACKDARTSMQATPKNRYTPGNRSLRRSAELLASVRWTFFCFNESVKCKPHNQSRSKLYRFSNDLCATRIGSQTRWNAAEVRSDRKSHQRICESLRQSLRLPKVRRASKRLPTNSGYRAALSAVILESGEQWMRPSAIAGPKTANQLMSSVTRILAELFLFCDEHRKKKRDAEILYLDRMSFQRNNHMQRMINTKQKPKTQTDVAMSAAINIAKLLVQTWTPQTYREQREYVNSLPGVRIVSLPRDEEFGYVPAEVTP